MQSEFLRGKFEIRFCRWLALLGLHVPKLCPDVLTLQPFRKCLRVWVPISMYRFSLQVQHMVRLREFWKWKQQNRWPTKTLDRRFALSSACLPTFSLDAGNLSLLSHHAFLRVSSRIRSQALSYWSHLPEPALRDHLSLSLLTRRVNQLSPKPYRSIEWFQTESAKYLSSGELLAQDHLYTLAQRILWILLSLGKEWWTPYIRP